jgi:hypothetical protein
MLQVATFLVPQDQDKANEFLKTHKPSPSGGINFNKDTIVIFYEDDPAADLVELLESVNKARIQQELSLYIMKAELADLNPTHNKGQYEQVQAQIFQIEDAIDNQDRKAEFLNQRIAQLRKK